MTAPRQPQDRKPKVKTFPFTGADGKPYTLPLASKGTEKMSGGDFMDAALGGEVGQVTYLFQVLVAAEPSPTALAALRTMPQDDMLDIIKAWGEYGDGDGASLGK
jgi:hypothetical protein